jgi:mannose-6-phosphate isomerase-like protein (cupin superfamily)
MKILRLPTQKDLVQHDGPHRFGAVWEVELDAGEATQPHRHDEIDEIYCFVEGEGEIVVANRKKPVVRGEVVHIPRLACHWVENNSRGLLRCLTIESPSEPRAEGAEGAEAAAAEKETIGRLESSIQELPREMDQVAAIKSIVRLFDIAGRLSEQIENAFGLDNEEGVQALGKVERRVMDAVVEITRRYQSQRGLDLGGFGGRLGRSGGRG